MAEPEKKSKFNWALLFNIALAVVLLSACSYNVLMQAKLAETVSVLEVKVGLCEAFKEQSIRGGRNNEQPQKCACNMINKTTVKYMIKGKILKLLFIVSFQMHRLIVCLFVCLCSGSINLLLSAVGHL